MAKPIIAKENTRERKVIKMWEKAYEILKLILNCGFELLDNNYHLQAQEIKHYSDLCKDYPIEVNNEIIGYLAVNERESRGENTEIQNAIKILQILFNNT